MIYTFNNASQQSRIYGDEPISYGRKVAMNWPALAGTFSGDCA